MRGAGDFRSLLGTGLWLQRWSLKLPEEQVEEKDPDNDHEQPTQWANFPTYRVHLVLPRNAEQERLGFRKE